MKKKIVMAVALMTATAMTLATVGCGKQTNESAEKNNTETATEETAGANETVVAQGNDINLDGYTMVWEDTFDNGFNEADWNYELHEPGWVNNELQAYVKSDQTVYVEDGILTIKPVKTENGYISGRVNTQNKHDFTYGIFEASIKMPEGKGFLPAFWMMPTDENTYGQWPRCGEIDIAEVLGDNTTTAYGTVHFGNPHKEDQGKYTLESGDFSKEFHTYTVEWNPGEIKWYIDGNLIHTANDWYTATEDIGEVTYPAPFDQPFYMILNLAVGGNWPGNPDATTDFDTASMQIDYVRVYQKDSYDENVKKPSKDVTFREPNADGNYVNNADFSVVEDLSDDADWKFLIDKGGEGSAEIKDNAIVISSSAAGTEDYAVQLIQSDMPMKKGCSYMVSFDAWSDGNRKMKVAVTAPNAGWVRYLTDTSLDLTTEKQNYVFEFDMTKADDPTGRLEFNLGNQGSTDTVYISNVKLIMTSELKEESPAKVILGDGNCIYNSKFQEGDLHMGSWEFSGGETADGVTKEVTPLKDGRRLHVTLAEDKSTPYTVGQTNLATSVGGKCILSFEATGSNTIEVLINGENVSFDLTDSMDKYTYEYIGTEDNDIQFIFDKAGDYYLDNVRIEENLMIKNGSFNAGTSGFEVYVDSSAEASYVVDSLSEDNAMDFSISATGDQDWKIQLKQNNVKMAKGKTYQLSFKAKSDINRTIRAIIQGQEDKGWAVYSEDIFAELGSEYQEYSCTFTMEADTDYNAFLSICLGAVNGEVISDKHRVVIDDIVLVEI